jgi:hypothetical protein
MIAAKRAATVAPARFRVGQVVMFPREGKLSLPVTILEVMETDGVNFYRIDRKNYLSEGMLRELTMLESGAQ